MAEQNFATKHQKLKDLNSATAAMDGFAPKQKLTQKESVENKVAVCEQLNKDIAKLEETLDIKRASAGALWRTGRWRTTARRVLSA